MLIGYSMPVVTAVALNSGAGAAWLTADGGVAVADGKPARRARAQWQTDDPAIGHNLNVQLSLASSIKPRIIAVLGLKNVPAGVTVWALGRLVGDAFFNYGMDGGSTAVTEQYADGSIGAWFVVGENSNLIDGIAIRLYNDKAGATWATGATTIDIGEIVAMPALDIEQQPDWEDELIDPTSSAISVGAQPLSVRRRGFRRLSVNFAVDGIANVRGAGLAGGMDWTKLRHALAGDRRAIGIPRWKNLAGNVDMVEVNRTALYGTARLAPLAHAGGDYYRASITFQEAPSPA